MWKNDIPLKPADVQNQLTDDFAYTTVMTILKRLADKELLKRDLREGAYYYSAAVTKEDFAENKLQKLFKGLINSYGDLAISQFISSVKEDPDNLESLKKYIKNNLDEE